MPATHTPKIADRCFCGANAISMSIVTEAVEITSGFSPYREYYPHTQTQTVTCANGHETIGSRPYPRADPPTPPLRLGPAEPEIVREAEYRRAFGEWDDDEWT